MAETESRIVALAMRLDEAVLQGREVTATAKLLALLRTHFQRQVELYDTMVRSELQRAYDPWTHCGPPHPAPRPPPRAPPEPAPPEPAPPLHDPAERAPPEILPAD